MSNLHGTTYAQQLSPGFMAEACASWWLPCCALFTLPLFQWEGSEARIRANETRATTISHRRELVFQVKGIKARCCVNFKRKKKEHALLFISLVSLLFHLNITHKKGIMGIRNKVDRVLANHSLSSTASQGTSNIPLSSHPSSNLTARHGFPIFSFVQFNKV